MAEQYQHNKRPRGNNNHHHHHAEECHPLLAAAAAAAGKKKKNTTITTSAWDTRTGSHVDHSNDNNVVLDIPIAIHDSVRIALVVPDDTVVQQDNGGTTTLTGGVLQQQQQHKGEDDQIQRHFRPMEDMNSSLYSTSTSTSSSTSSSTMTKTTYSCSTSVSDNTSMMMIISLRPMILSLPTDMLTVETMMTLKPTMTIPTATHTTTNSSSTINRNEYDDQYGSSFAMVDVDVDVEDVVDVVLQSQKDHIDHNQQQLHPQQIHPQISDLEPYQRLGCLATIHVPNIITMKQKLHTTLTTTTAATTATANSLDTSRKAMNPTHDGTTIAFNTTMNDIMTTYDDYHSHIVNGSNMKQYGKVELADQQEQKWIESLCTMSGWDEWKTYHDPLVLRQLLEEYIQQPNDNYDDMLTSAQRYNDHKPHDRHLHFLNGHQDFMWWSLTNSWLYSGRLSKLRRIVSPLSILILMDANVQQQQQDPMDNHNTTICSKGRRMIYPIHCTSLSSMLHPSQEKKLLRQATYSLADLWFSCPETSVLFTDTMIQWLIAWEEYSNAIVVSIIQKNDDPMMNDAYSNSVLMNSNNAKKKALSLLRHIRWVQCQLCTKLGQYYHDKDNPMDPSSNQLMKKPILSFQGQNISVTWLQQYFEENNFFPNLVHNGDDSPEDTIRILKDQKQKQEKNFFLNLYKQGLGHWYTDGNNNNHEAENGASSVNENDCITNDLTMSLDANNVIHTNNTEHPTNNASVNHPIDENGNKINEHCASNHEHEYNQSKENHCNAKTNDTSIGNHPMMIDNDNSINDSITDDPYTQEEHNKLLDDFIACRTPDDCSARRRAKNGHYLFSLQDDSMSENAFLEEAGFMEQVNSTFPRPYHPFLSRARMTSSHFTLSLQQQLQKLFFNTDGSLRKSVCRDASQSARHNYIAFANGNAGVNDRRWQVPIKSHSHTPMGSIEIPTRLRVEQLLAQAGLFDPLNEEIEDIGVLIGGTEDQSIHHDISRQFTFWVPSKKNQEEPILGWEVNRLAYNASMASSYAPRSLLIGLGGKSVIYLGIQKDQIRRVSQQSCQILLGRPWEAFSVVRENSALVVVEVPIGCEFTGDFQHAGVRNIAVGSAEETLLGELLGKVDGIMSSPEYQERPTDRTRATIELLGNFPGLDKLSRFHCSTQPKNAQMKIPKNAIGFTSCIENPVDNRFIED